MTSLFHRFKAIAHRELFLRESEPLSVITKIIVVEKCLKSIFLGLLAISIFPIFSDTFIDTLQKIAARSHFLSNAQVVTYFFSWIEVASNRRLFSFSLFFALWGILETTEAIGLYKRRRWAEYLTVVGTGIFIPIECYSVLYRPTPEKIVILSFNIFLVVYLIWNHKLFIIKDSSRH